MKKEEVVVRKTDIAEKNVDEEVVAKDLAPNEAAVEKRGGYLTVNVSINSNLKERDEESRDNGQAFEMKVALQLGRSLSELRDRALKERDEESRDNGKDIEKFGSKLF
ncbi:hypothetical protein L2E82_40972 [Cichorium intybus]|uniref:Uncharacterized protein n=1 Tax=Cichorium intybus TaxID=13427 RepID=A0ACB9ANN9_CICIN|nr:hypothetical protein L2E82_40972 [Cichorium intybus]